MIFCHRTLQRVWAEGNSYALCGDHFALRGRLVVCFFFSFPFFSSVLEGGRSLLYSFFFPFYMSLSSLSFSSTTLLLIRGPLFLRPGLHPRRGLGTGPGIFLPLLALTEGIVLLRVIAISLVIIPVSLVLRRPVTGGFLLDLLALIVLVEIIVRLSVVIPVLGNNLPIVLGPAFHDVLGLAGVV